MFTFSVCFVFTDAWALVNTAGRPSLEQVAHLDPDNLTLPSHLGEIRYTHKADPNKIIIHIQDAHSNQFAQKKISGIIDFLNREYGIKMINLEGGTGDYDLKVFNDISIPAVRKEVAEYFVKNGEINGAELYAINNPGAAVLWGVEDKELYLENLKVYRDSLRHKGRIDGYLKELSYVMDNLKRHIYNQDLLRLDASYSKYKSGEMTFKEYVTVLIKEARQNAIQVREYPNLYLIAQALEQESNVDFEKANRERNALVEELKDSLSKNDIGELSSKSLDFKTGRISREVFYGYLLEKARETGLDIKNFPELSNYVVYVTLFDSVDRFKVSKELNELEKQIKETLYINDTQRHLDELSRNLIITRNIFNISLTKDDYSYYLENKDSFEVNNYLKFIEEEAPKYRITTRPSDRVKNLDIYLKDMSRFYGYSFKRDDAFLRNMRFVPSGDAQNISILMTGGFHTENLCELFEKNNISYISIIPKFVSDKEYECPYFGLLAGEATGIQQMLSSALAKNSTLQIASKLNGQLVEPEKVDTFNAAVRILAKLIETRGPEVVNEKIEVALSANENNVFIAVGETGEDISYMSLEEAGLEGVGIRAITGEEAEEGVSQKAIHDMEEEEFRVFLRETFSRELNDLKARALNGGIADINFGAEYSALIDRTIMTLLEYLGASKDLTLIAMGSYARRSSPYGTDIDMFILIDDFDENDPKKEELRGKAKKLVNILDGDIAPLGFTHIDCPGYPPGFVDGNKKNAIWCITPTEFARGYDSLDVLKPLQRSTIRSVLDWRLIGGAKKKEDVKQIFKNITEKHRTLEKVTAPTIRVEDLKLIVLNDRDLDQEDIDDFLVKKAPGGLRSMDMLIWALRAKLDIPYVDWTKEEAVEDIFNRVVKSGEMTPDQVKRFKEARTFMIGLRTAINIAWGNNPSLLERVEEEVGNSLGHPVRESLRREIVGDVAEIFGMDKETLIAELKRHSGNVTGILRQFFTLEDLVEQLLIAEKEQYENFIREDAAEYAKLMEESAIGLTGEALEKQKKSIRAYLDGIVNLNFVLEQKNRMTEALNVFYLVKLREIKEKWGDEDSEGFAAEYSELLDQLIRMSASIFGIENNISIISWGGYGQKGSTEKSNIDTFVLYKGEDRLAGAETLLRVVDRIAGGRMSQSAIIGVDNFSKNESAKYLTTARPVVLDPNFTKGIENEELIEFINKLPAVESVDDAAKAITPRAPPGAGSWWNNWVYGVFAAPWFEAAIPKYGIATPLFHMASPQLFWIAAITAAIAAALVYFAFHFRYNREAKEKPWYKRFHLAKHTKIVELGIFTGLTFLSTFLILIHSSIAKPFLVVTIGAHFILNAKHYWSNIVSFAGRAKKFLTTPVGFITTMGVVMFTGTLAIYASSGFDVTRAIVLQALALEGWMVVFGYLLFYSYNAQKSENRLVRASAIVSAIVTLAVFSLFPRIADANVLTYQPKPAAIVREIVEIEEVLVFEEVTPPEAPVEAVEEVKTLEGPGLEDWVPLVRQELKIAQESDGPVDLTRAVIHHTVSPRSWNAAKIDEVHKLNKDKYGKPWKGIGYHWVIGVDDKGEVFVEKGRSMTERGAHAPGRNNNIGIALSGYDEFTPEQLASLKRLLEELGVKYVQPHHENCPGIGVSLGNVVGPTILVQAPKRSAAGSWFDPEAHPVYARWLAWMETPLVLAPLGMINAFIGFQSLPIIAAIGIGIIPAYLFLRPHLKSWRGFYFQDYIENPSAIWALTAGTLAAGILSVFGSDSLFWMTTAGLSLAHFAWNLWATRVAPKQEIEGFFMSMKGPDRTSEENIERRNKRLKKYIKNGEEGKIEREGLQREKVIIEGEETITYVHKDIIDRLALQKLTLQQFIDNCISVRGPTFSDEIATHLFGATIIIDALSKSPNLYGNAQSPGYIYVNTTAPIELDEIGFSHALMREIGFSTSLNDDVALANQDIWLIARSKLNLSEIIDGLENVEFTSSFSDLAPSLSTVESTIKPQLTAIESLMADSMAREEGVSAAEASEKVDGRLWSIAEAHHLDEVVVVNPLDDLLVQEALEFLRRKEDVREHIRKTKGIMFTRAPPLEGIGNVVYIGESAEEIARQIYRILGPEYFWEISIPSAKEVQAGDVRKKLFVDVLPSETIEMLRRTTDETELSLDDFTGEVNLSFHNSGANKEVFKLIFIRKDREAVESTFQAYKKEKDRGKIYAEELQDLEMLSGEEIVSSRTGLPYLPRFGMRFRDGEGYIEEFIPGKTAWELLRKGELTLEHRREIVEAVLKTGLALGSFPLDVHAKNFIISEKRGVVFVDIGHRRIRPWPEGKTGWEYVNPAESVSLISTLVGLYGYPFGEAGTNDYILQMIKDILPNGREILVAAVKYADRLKNMAKGELQVGEEVFLHEEEMVSEYAEEEEGRHKGWIKTTDDMLEILNQADRVLKVTPPSQAVGVKALPAYDMGKIPAIARDSLQKLGVPAEEVLTPSQAVRDVHGNRIGLDRYELPVERFGVSDINIAEELEAAVKSLISEGKLSFKEMPVLSIIGSMSYALTADGDIDWDLVEDIDARIHSRSVATPDDIKKINTRLFEGLWKKKVSVDKPYDEVFIIEKGTGKEYKIQILPEDERDLFNEEAAGYEAYEMSHIFFGNKERLNGLIAEEGRGIAGVIQASVRRYNITLKEIVDERKSQEEDDYILTQKMKLKLLKSLYQLAHTRAKGEEFRYLLDDYKRLSENFDEKALSDIFYRAVKELTVSNEELESDLRAARAISPEAPTPSQAAAITVEAPLQRPVVDNSLDPARVDAFINAHKDPEVRELVEFLVKNISYITQEEFEEAIEEVVSDFNQGLSGKPFVSYIPYGADKSNRWTYRIAEERGLAGAEGVFYIADEKAAMAKTDPGSFVEWHKANHTGVKDVAYVDDAAYSGRQLENILDQFSWYVEDGQYLDNVTVHLVIPYVSAEARSKIYVFNKKMKDRGLSMRVSLHEKRTEKTSTIGEMFERLEIADQSAHDRLWPLFQHIYDYDGERTNKTMFSFQHKSPDIFSFFSVRNNGVMVPLLEGPVVDGQGKYVSQMALVPPVMTPYSEGYLDWVEKNIRGSEWESRLTDRAPPEAAETVRREAEKMVEEAFKRAEAKDPEVIAREMEDVNKQARANLLKRYVNEDNMEGVEKILKVMSPDEVKEIILNMPSEEIGQKLYMLLRNSLDQRQMETATKVIGDIDKNTVDWIITPTPLDPVLGADKTGIVMKAKGIFRKKTGYTSETILGGYNYSRDYSDDVLEKEFRKAFVDVIYQMDESEHYKDSENKKAIVFVPLEKRDLAIEVLKKLMGVETEEEVEKKFIVVKENIPANGLVDEVNHINVGKGFLDYKRAMERGASLEKPRNRLIEYLKTIVMPESIDFDNTPDIIEQIINGKEYLPMMRPVDLNTWREEQDARLQILRSL